MAIIPNTVCRRCHRQFPATRRACPYCGEKREREQKRAIPVSDSAVRGTVASAKKRESLNWQMLFGSLIVLAIIILVIVMLSHGIGDDIASLPQDTSSLSVGEYSGNYAGNAGATAVPVETTTPTPTPEVTTIITSLAITYYGADEPSFVAYTGDLIQLDVSFYPLNSELTPVWSSSDESVATVDQTGLVTMIGEGYCEVSVEVAGTKDICEVYCYE